MTRRSGGVRRTLGLLAAVWLLSRAAAADAADVLVVRPTLDDRFIEEIFHRVGGELRVHAFVVREQQPSGDDVSMAEARALLAGSGAAACISFIWQGDTSVVRVWVAGPSGTPALFEAVSLQRTPDVPTVLAARAVDLLTVALDRNRPLAALPPGGSPVADSTAPTLTVAPPAAITAAPRDWSLAVGAALIIGGGRFGNAAGPELALARALARRWAIGVRLAAPLWGQRLGNDDASAKQTQALGLIEGQTLLASWRALAVRARVGLGADYLRINGDVVPAVASAMPAQATAWVATAAAGVALSLAVSPRVAVDVGGGVCAAWPRPHIHLGHETVALTQPQPSLTVGVRFDL
ncbi:MAG TPA: hypothetical protein VH374_14235 [Polyangia bacterium]|nr:hypothetical protein [Polyangia bacterium]